MTSSKNANIKILFLCQIVSFCLSWSIPMSSLMVIPIKFIAFLAFYGYYLFHDRGNQWTGFYMTGTSVMKELTRFPVLTEL